jgi:inner membrane protein
MGDAFAGKQLGKRAMFLGAVAQSVPDIDFIASFWTNTVRKPAGPPGIYTLFSFRFAGRTFPGISAERWHRPHDISIRKWILFFSVQAFIHLFLDGMNVYGVGWFEPFQSLQGFL